MKKLVFVSLLSSLAVPVLGSAQDAPTPPPPPPPPAEEAAASDPAPVDGESHQEMSEGHEIEEPTETDEGSWTDRLTYNIFADAFYMVDWNRPQNPTAATAVPHRDYTYTDGFGLAFAGVDAMYHGDHFGATVSLRYGVGAQRYLIGGNLNTAVGAPGAPVVSYAGATPALAAVKQAYGSIMPTDSLTIDVGLWDTIYGAEVADSWVNFNYSRTPLNYLMQPFYHLGVRATYQATDHIVAKAFLANSTNAYSGFSGGPPYIGTQIGYTSDVFSAYAGYMTGQMTRSGDWEHFVDFVATLSVGDFSLVGNFDLWKNPSTNPGWGVSVVAAYQISDMFGVAVRGDAILPDDYYWTSMYDQLYVGTATLDFRPYGDHVILRLEHRFEHANNAVYADSNSAFDPMTGAITSGGSKTWMSTVLSAVIRTGN